MSQTTPTNLTEPAPAANRGPRRFVFSLATALVLLAGTLYTRQQVADGGLRTIILFVGTSLSVGILICWFLFGSGLPGRIRGLVGFLLLAGVVGISSVYRVERFDGSLIPTIALRSAPPRDATLEPSLKNEVGDVKPDLTVTSPSDFPGFLGKDGKNQVDGVRIGTDWKSNPPKLLWKRDVGAGWSGFAVVNGFACTLEQRGSQELVTCYELASGRPCWSHAVQARHSSGLGSVGPRSTPTIHSGKVFVQGSTGIVRCLDGSTGEAVWARDLFKDFGMSQEEAEAVVAWGRSGSPLVYEDKLIVPIGGKPGGKQAGIIALDLSNGTTVWESEAFQAAYASPRAAILNSVPQILMVNEDFVSSHDPLSGKTLWTHDWPGKSTTNASVSQPVPIDGSRVLLSKGYMTGAAMLEVIPDDGEWSVVVLWENPRALRTKFSNVAIHKGEAYGLDERFLQCADLETGDVHWTSEKLFGYGQILRVEDLLLVMSEKGVMHLVAADKSEYRELASYPVLEGQTWNTFCLVNNRLLVRNAEFAACYELPLAGE